MSSRPIRIGWDFDYWHKDYGSISASNSDSSDLGPSNVLVNDIGLPWRSNDDSVEWIKRDLGTARRVTMMCIFGHNFTADADVVLQGNSVDYWSPPDYQLDLTVAVNPWGVAYPRIVVFLDKTYRYWRLSINDPTTPTGKTEVAWWKGCEYWEPGRSFSRSFRIDKSDPSEGDRVPGKDTALTRRRAFRRARAGIPRGDQTLFDAFDGVFDKVGNHSPVVVCWDPLNNPSRDALYGRIETDLSAQHVHSGTWDYTSIVFEEKTE